MRSPNMSDRYRQFVIKLSMRRSVTACIEKKESSMVFVPDDEQPVASACTNQGKPDQCAGLWIWAWAFSIWACLVVQAGPIWDTVSMKYEHVRSIPPWLHW